MACRLLIYGCSAELAVITWVRHRYVETPPLFKDQVRNSISRTALTGQEKVINIQRSTITIHVWKVRLFSVVGHEHWVEAPVSSGVVNESMPERVEFSVEASKMQVKPDPKIDPKTQAQIQKDMQKKVLEVARFLQIAFRSSRVEKRAEAQWRVEGALTLHGIDNQISLSQ